jgi:site-specific recombinase XerD
MKINFRLKNQSKASSYIFADILINNIRIKYSLKINVNTALFDENKQRLKGNSIESNQINLLLSKYENDISRVIRDLQYSGTFRSRDIKSKLDDLFRFKETLIIIEDEVFFTDYILKIIDNAKITKKPRTIKTYHTTLNKLISYEQKTKQKLTFLSIDYSFYSLFIQYCKKDLSLAPNTLGGHIKNIKVFMKIAFDNGDTDNIAFKKSSFKTMSEDVDSVYLNEEELQKIKSCILSTDRLDNVRDIFLIACYTGLRISDYSKIIHKNIIHEGKILKVLTEKTNEEVFIPLNSHVKLLLEKYNHSIKMISQQRFNEYLKEVCELAGINELVTFYQTRGDKKIQITSPKYKLVTSHTARRSFATNAFKAGIPSISIMKITGHKTEKSFLKYIKITKEENAKLIMEHTFFK